MSVRKETAEPTIGSETAEDQLEQARRNRAEARRAWPVRLSALGAEQDDGAFVAGGPAAGVYAVGELSRRLQALHPDGHKPFDRSMVVVRYIPT